MRIQLQPPIFVGYDGNESGDPVFYHLIHALI